MDYLVTLSAFLLIISIATLICLLMKMFEQKNIKKKRLEVLVLTKNTLCKDDYYIEQSLTELYTKTFSHYLTYCIGHFSSILVNIYSIILSITSLAMIAFSDDNNLTSIISLLSTLFVVTLVFSRLDERSSYHLAAWRKCEKTITDIAKLMSNYYANDTNTNDINKENIYSLINSCRFSNINWIYYFYL